jgi:hypothetical protein
MPPRSSTWFAIASVLILEIAAAVLLAAVVAQAYIAYECGDSAYREQHADRCEGGVPYPLF